ncbi:MAG: 5-(carboxyamino)imidazole ribonucleotide mutase [Elusimicrobiales bacterium]
MKSSVRKTKVGILVGSHSDLEIMKDAVSILKEFKVSYEINVISAHRMPHKLFEYATTAESRGLEVIIAAAGGAAHLPGITAALTTIPVIGVPIKSQSLNGLDSLLSIVQMPSGIPVATVAINGAKNAAILAIQIISIKHPQIRQKIKDFREKMRKEIESKKIEL